MLIFGCFLKQVHDCFSCNELFMYEALQLAPEGKGSQLVRSGTWRTNNNGGEQFLLGGRWVVNPTGGLESKGHPIGATGRSMNHALATSLGYISSVLTLVNFKNAYIGHKGVIKVHGFYISSHVDNCCIDVKRKLNVVFSLTRMLFI